MELLVSYYGSGIDGRDAPVLFPIEEESVELAKSRFRHEVRVAAMAGHRSFCLWGRRHFVHNFLREVSLERFELAVLAAQRKNGKVPEGFRLSEANRLQESVGVFRSLPEIRTLQASLYARKLEHRALRWMSAGKEYVHFLDELWNRDIALSAVQSADGMRIVSSDGREAVLRPDGEYYIEGYQDDLTIYFDGRAVGIREEEDGYAIVEIR